MPESNSLDSNIDFLNAPVGKRLNRLAKQYVPYFGYLLFHIVLSPFFAIQGIVRAKRRFYQPILWRRFWGGSKIPRGATVLLAGGLGESRIANQLASEIKELVGPQLVILTQNEVPPPPVAHCPFGAAPFNSPLSVLLFLLKSRPRAILAPEFCENIHLKFATRLLGVPVVVFNVHTTEREVSRKKRWSSWRYQLAGMYITQNETHRDRLLAMGVAPDQVVVLGPIGIFLDPRPYPASILQKWKEEVGFGQLPGPVILCGSSHTGDESFSLTAWNIFVAKVPHATLVIAPRNSKRFTKLPDELREAGHLVVCRSSCEPPPAGGIYVLDTHGELADAYSIADVTLVGGTFDAWRGGHTTVEALLWGVPITIGPYFPAQAAVVERLIEQGIAQICHTSEELAAAWMRFATEPGLRESIGEKSKVLSSTERENGRILYKALNLS